MRSSVTGAENTGPRKIRVLHVINSFEYGGAEAMLCNLLLRADRDRFDVSVAALIEDLTVAAPLLRAGIPIAVMGMRPGVPDPAGLARLARHLRRVRPAVVQSWMDHSNLFAALATRIGPPARLVWGVHHCDHLPGIAKRSTLATVAACAALSRRVPDRIVYCSEHSREQYQRRGFASDKAVVIPNGFDLDAFRPDAAAREQVRREVGVPPDAPLIGLVARYDPLKDHSTFLRAASILSRRRPHVRFLLCGHNVLPSNPALGAQIASLGLSGCCHLLGPRRDVARVLSALDVAASSSISEAFPLAVGEAMACGVPCVVTDVGDSALIVGPTGRVVPPRDPAAMADAWARVLELPPAQRAVLGASARRRVRERFALDGVARRYEDLYEQLANTPAKNRRRTSEPLGSRFTGSVYVQPGC